MKNVRNWNCLIFLAVLAAVGLVFFPMTALADDESPAPEEEGSVEQEGSSLSSPAEAQRTENLAEIQASKDASVLEAGKTLADAEAALAEAQTADTSNETAIAEAEAALAKAEAAYEKTLADATGASAEEISEMRASGMGWGEIAHELGIHPSALGLGHTKQQRAGEMNQETARDMKGAQGKGHGSKSGDKGGGKGGDKGGDKGGGKGGDKGGGKGGNKK